MIIGKGDIASALKKQDRKDLLFFASCVSNSGETRESEYKREIDLLLKQDRDSHIVYFGSLCVYHSDSRYARHKRYMEQLVKKFKTHTTIRIGNIDWGTNPYTLINYLRNRKKKGQKLQIMDVYRYILNRKEFDYWISLIPPWSCEMNIPGRRMKMSKVVKEYLS